MAIFTRVDKVFYCNKYRKYYQKKKEKKERRKGKEQKREKRNRERNKKKIRIGDLFRSIEEADRKERDKFTHHRKTFSF